MCLLWFSAVSAIELYILVILNNSFFIKQINQVFIYIKFFHFSMFNQAIQVLNLRLLQIGAKRAAKKQSLPSISSLYLHCWIAWKIHFQGLRNWLEGKENTRKFQDKCRVKDRAIPYKIHQVRSYMWVPQLCCLSDCQQPWQLVIIGPQFLYIQYILIDL